MNLIQANIWAFRPTRILLVLTLGLALGTNALGLGQKTNRANSVLKVFFDAPGLDAAALIKDLGCFESAPDRTDAQVIIAITSKTTDRGQEYAVSFAGQKDFRGLDDILAYFAPPDELPEETQQGLARTVKLGLMRYAACTPLAGRFSIALKDKVSPTAVADPWDFWMFNISTNAWLNGETSYKSQMLFGSVSANRVTEALKVRLSLSAMYEKDDYDYEDYQYESTMDSLSFRGLVVKSLGEHWSVGGDVSVYKSSFSNTELAYGIAPGIEYDLFPYSESTKRQLRILYHLGFQRIKYTEETIYDKTAESLLQHVLSATLEVKQPWGTVSTTLEGSNFLHDFTKYRVELNGEISLRIFQGLEFNVDGGTAWIHDQLSLPKAGASLVDVLLQRKQLATNYDYFFMVGLNFSFGSIRSNVVNPRFGSAGGGGFSMNISM